MRKFRELALRASALLLILVLVLGTTVSCGESKVSYPYEDIPAYSGAEFVVINGNTPFFTRSELTSVGYEKYSPLDSLGRCGVAIACVGLETMPTEGRGNISSITPTGLRHNGKSNNNKYSFIDGEYIYNRCHLIGFQLTGENANERNLITGTRYFNVTGMLQFENMVAAIVKDTGVHVMYRVTPYFIGYEYVARGVLIEAYSVEDDGESLTFCVYVYNVQPGVIINYYTGENSLDTNSEIGGGGSSTAAITYVLNKNTKKYHLESCHHAVNMKVEYRLEYSGKTDAFSTAYPDYEPCGTCKPDKQN